MKKDAVYTSYTQNIYRPLEERVFFKPFSGRVANVLKNTRVSPTFFNFLSFALAVSGGFVLFTALAHKNILAAVILYLAFLSDKIDGDLARAKGIAGGRGQYIDGFLDLLGEFSLTILIALATGFRSVALVGLSVAGPLLFYYHGVATPFYLRTMAPTYLGQKSGWRSYLKDAVSYNRCKHFLLLIVLLLMNAPSIFFYLLPLLVPYTLILFFKNFFRH